MPRAGGQDEAEKTAPKHGEKQVEIAGIAVAAKGGGVKGGWGGKSARQNLVDVNQEFHRMQSLIDPICL